jgi:hypothetical protein
MSCTVPYCKKTLIPGHMTDTSHLQVVYLLARSHVNPENATERGRFAHPFGCNANFTQHCKRGSSRETSGHGSTEWFQIAKVAGRY